MKSLGLLYIAMLFLCGSVYAERTVWYVHPDSTLNTIQAGLDSCADNDIVLVGPGTYIENIIWPNTQGIHLVSELGPDVTIVDGDSAGSVIEITTGVDTATVIRGFTIRNGAASYGGGINCNYASSVTIAHNIISGNHAGGGTWVGGGGIMCYYAIIDSNIIQDNICYEEGGGGIFCGGNALITKNTIINNSAPHGGGIGCYLDIDPPTITDNIIQNNNAYSGGGIAFVSEFGGGTAVMINNVITGNTAEYGGGISADGNSLIMNNSTITNNTALVSGGGIRATSAGWPVPQVIIDNSTISSNSECGVVSGIHICVTMDSCNIKDNVGDGISTTGRHGSSIHYCNITGNSGYGVCSVDTFWVNAEDNWWGDASGPGGAGSGTGDSVSEYVDFDPWLTDPGVEEQPIVSPVEKRETLTATIFRGPLQLPEGRKCRVFDITGRNVEPDKIQPGIYFIEIDGVVSQKVIKVR